MKLPSVIVCGFCCTGFLFFCFVIYRLLFLLCFHQVQVCNHHTCPVLVHHFINIPGLMCCLSSFIVSCVSSALVSALAYGQHLLLFVKMVNSFVCVLCVYDKPLQMILMNLSESYFNQLNTRWSLHRVNISQYKNDSLILSTQ